MFAIPASAAMAPTSIGTSSCRPATMIATKTLHINRPVRPPARFFQPHGDGSLDRVRDRAERTATAAATQVVAQER